MLMLESLLTGVAVGAVFAYLKLPAPAPLELEGILGIVGVWAGYVLISMLVQRYAL